MEIRARNPLAHQNSNGGHIDHLEPQNVLHDVIDWNHGNRLKENPSFFWRSHTISVLVVLLLVLCYITFIDDNSGYSSDYNAKKGILACFVVFIAFGITQARDGPFLRPHPVIWRFVLCCSVIYELCLIFLLFQTSTDARRWMSHFDPTLGKNLPEQDYGGNCSIYDSLVPNNPWHNVKDKFDVFVPAHFFGWWIKTLILRDYWLTFVLSLMFEILEYTLQHQLPNFSECWWDHWFMDFVLCNGGGIYLGMLTLQHLECKKYNWRTLWSIPTYSGKLGRIFQQFTPYSWRKFNWDASHSMKRFSLVVGIIFMFSLAELNVFYMKAALWIPSTHYTVGFRLGLFSLMGLVACRETYDYLNDSSCKRFGQQSWILAAIIITESLICIKFLWEIVTLLPPKHILTFWGLFLTCVATYTLWLFLMNFFYPENQTVFEQDNGVMRKQTKKE